MQPDRTYEDLKMEEIMEEDWYEYDEDRDDLGIWSESAMLEIEEEE